MIVVDSSALVAILEHEIDAAVYARAIERADRLLISAVNVHETGIVLRIRRGRAALDQLWRFLLSENDFEVAAFDEIQARLATSAFERYGKGIHSKARLNLADCAAYALASSVSAPLLFKGDDFSETDVKVCLLD
jgi:ribonuclease VapC